MKNRSLNRQKRICLSTLAAAGVIAALAMPPQASAASCTWTPATGNWSTASDWSCGVVPGSSDTANIGASKVVTINSTQSILTLGNAGGINIDAFLLTLQGGGSTTNTGTINVGGPSTAALQISSGHNVNNTGGVINVTNGSVVNQFGSTITGGTISTTGTGALVAFNNGANFLNSVTLNGKLDLATGTGIERVTGGLTMGSGSTINIGSDSVFAPQGDQTIAGSGTIAFVDASSNNRLNVEAGNLTLGSGITVRGGNGIIGQQAFVGGAATLTNQGLISADVAGRSITLTVNGAVINQGTMQAQNGGQLILNAGGGYDNSAGVMLADTGSTVLQNGATITGGTLNSNGTGKFVATNNGSNFLNGATLNGVIDLASATGTERISASGMTLNGTINIGNNSVLAPQGNQTIAGTGSIVFADNNGNNRLNVEAGNLVLGSGITVRGQTGVIGQQAFASGAATLTNNGTIQADVAGGAITLQVNGLTTNNGTLAAQNGATLNLNSAVQGNTGSQILAGAGSVVAQNGVTLSGNMNLTGPGSFRAGNSGSNFLSGVTLSGTLDMASAFGIERVTGGLTLNGTINIGNASILAPQGTQTIGGSGTIVFADADANNRLNIEAGTTTLASGITVRGGNGIIGNQSFVGGAATLVNQGVIAADVSGRTITVQTTSGTTNQNVMRADNGGTLLLQGSGVDNSAGTLLASNGSTVRVNGITVTGGALNSSGTGRITATNSGSNFLNGTTLNGLLDLVGGGIARISSGGMTVNGRIDIGGAGVLAPQGTQTIDGTGEIVFTDSNTANRLNIEAGALTIGAGVTVRGQTGVIGAQNFLGGAATLTNLGTINSDGGATITVNPNGALTNNGLFRAQNGTLAVQRNVTGTGTLQVDTTGVVTLTNGGNTQGQLVMGAAGAALNLGTGNLTINNDYTNVGAGSGNSFNRRAGVSGTGLIVAGGDVAQAITGANVTNGNTANATLTINNVRVGATTFDYQIANTGSTGPSLRGAIQTNVNGANLTDARLIGAGVTASNYNTGAPGSDTGNLGVTFTAASAGALAPLSGQVLNLRSNFENIADQKLNIVLGAGAAAYNAAAGNAAPSPVTVANQRVGGSNTSALTITNTAPSGAFTEGLNASFTGTSGQANTNGGSIALLAGGASNNSAMRVGVDTSSAGAKSGSVTLGYQSDGTGTSGLSAINVGSQTVNVSGNVYRVAQGAATPAPINFGNRHVGDAASQVLTVQNTAANDGFSEKLNASFGANTGAATNNGGSINLLAAGGSNNTNMTVGLDTSSAGARSGTVAVDYQSDGDGTSGLAAIAAGSQTVNVSGNVYRLAQANSIAPINFGNVLVGSSQTQTVSISNLATADGFSEALNAAFGAIGGTNPSQFSAAGFINQLAAGANDNASMVITLDTTSAGTYSANVQILLNSDGTGTSGLGITALPTQVINLDGVVTGTVGNLAQAGPHSPEPVNFGNVRIGSTQNQVLSIQNTATGPAEGLNASIATNSAGVVTASGAFMNLAPQATNNTDLIVGLNTSVAGARAGTATIALESDGSFNSGTATPLPSQTVNVAGNVYRLANPTVNTGSVNLAARVGDASPSASISVTNTSPDIFTEGLNVTRGSTTPADFTSSGSISNLAAGTTDSSAIQVALNTSTAGTFTGTQGLNFVSTGVGTTGAADISVGTGNVNLNGKVYTPAQASVGTTSINFGIVHVGDVVAAQTVSLANSAPATALNDTLSGSLGGASAPFSAGGSVSGLTAGGPANNTSLQVGLNTSTAGIFTDNGTLMLASQNPDMPDLALADVSIDLNAQVNNYADAALRKNSGSGSFTGGGNLFVLDFGTVVFGSGAFTSILEAFNSAFGPADLLDGVFSFLDTQDFTYTGFGSFNNLAAGQGNGGMSVGFNPLALGSFSDNIQFASLGHNASGYSGALPDILLRVQGNVVAGGTVPEPGTWALLALGCFMLTLMRMRRGVR